MKKTAIVLAGQIFLLVATCLPVHAQSTGAPYLTGYRYQPNGGPLLGVITPAPSGQTNFLATRNTYDSYGRLEMVETGVLSAWQADNVTPANWSGFSVAKSVIYSYDANGRKIMERVGGDNGATTNVTQFAYDDFDRLTCTTVRMNLGVWVPIDACALGTEGPDGPDRITKNVYDSLNRVTQIRRAVGTSFEQAYVTYGYTADGLREYVVDANGNKSRLTYDGHDRQNGWYFPSNGAPPAAFNPATQTTALASSGAVSSSDYEAYGYDNNGNRNSLRKRDGQSMSYQHDALNRVWLKDVPGTASDVYYGYDLRGLQTYARFGSSSGPGITNSYDGFGLRRSSTNTMSGGAGRTVGHDYDDDGNLRQVTHPDGNYFAYTRDGMGRFTGILENNSTAVAGQTYHPNGLRWTQTRVGVSTVLGYDNASRLQSWADNLAGSSADVTTTFTYNAANQIGTRTRANTSYDFTGYAGGNFTYTPNGLNQYASVGGVTFNHDLNGNLTWDGSTGYTYDVENRLVSVSGAHSATLTYDPLGRLFQIDSGGTRTQFLYDGDELAAEYNGSGTLLQRYVHGAQNDDPLIWYEGGAVNAGARRSLQTDYLGSIVSIADASGAPTKINRYDEYGVPGTSNAGRFQYTGQVWLAELGLNYYKARLYDPRIGRFLQTDPIGYDDDFNLYAYVKNDPLNNTDPTGMDSASCYTASGCGGGIRTSQAALEAAADFTPVIGDAKGIVDAVRDPTAVNIIAAGVGLVPIVGDLGKGALKNADLVVRGGAATPAGGNSVEGIAKGTGTHPSGVTGFSAEASAGATLCELCGNIPQNQVGVTTVGDIRAAGGDVVPTSGRSPNHVTVTGLDPADANKLLTPTQRNPVPPDERRFR